MQQDRFSQDNQPEDSLSAMQYEKDLAQRIIAFAELAAAMHLCEKSLEILENEIDDQGQDEHPALRRISQR